MEGDQFGVPLEHELIAQHRTCLQRLVQTVSCSMVENTVSVKTRVPQCTIMHSIGEADRVHYPGPLEH